MQVASLRLHWQRKKLWLLTCLGACAIIYFLCAPVSSAQTVTRKDPSPAANPADVESITAIITAAFDVMSGPAGKERDWNRFRSLFKPSAQFIIAPRLQNGSGINFTVRNIDDFITNSWGWLEKNAVYEVEVHRIVEQYGHMAHAFSTYESRDKPGARRPSSRGLSSFQLVHDGKRWWIVNWFWLGERPNTPIPKKYLPRNRG